MFVLLDTFEKRITMNNLINRNFLILLCAFLITAALAYSCGTNRETIDTVRLDHKSDRELEAALHEQNNIPFDFMSVRIAVDIESTAQNASFSCFIKLDVDSLIGGTIKSAAIVFATFRVSADSIIFVKKLDKCYFAESLDYVSTLFGTTLEFDFFQSLLLGLPIGIEEGTKYEQIRVNDQDHYILSSHKRRDFIRLEQNRLNSDEEDMFIQYHLNPSLEIFEIGIQIPSDTTSISVNYSERIMSDEFKVPKSTQIVVRNPKDTLTIKLDYGTVKINEPSEISINIPENYVECP